MSNIYFPPFIWALGGSKFQSTFRDDFLVFKVLRTPTAPPNGVGELKIAELGSFV